MLIISCYLALPKRMHHNVDHNIKNMISEIYINQIIIIIISWFLDLRKIINHAILRF